LSSPSEPLTCLYRYEILMKVALGSSVALV
jgi:hypothetical protein